jgi:hypothetical protein
MNRFNVDEILNSITENGFADLTGIISDQQIDTINEKIKPAMDQPHSNGQRGYVKQGCQRYLADTLSYGKEIIDVYTNPLLIEIAEKYAEDIVHLSNYRIYSTYPSEDFKMWWHLDNKIDTYDFEKKAFIQQLVPDDKGLIFLMYLSNVVDGGVQLVRKSHKWSKNHNQESFDHMEDEFKDQVVTFNNCPKGTFVVYDYATIHRAKPYNGGQVRTSMFGQLSPSRMPTGEPILLNVRDISELSEKQKQILSFGKKPTTLNWPIGDINAFYPPVESSTSIWSKFKTKFSAKH